MKTSDFAKYGKALSPELPQGFVANKNLIFISPIEDILRGIFFMNSTDANVFYFLVFFLPLYVPHNSLGAHAKRLRFNGHERWHSNDIDIMINLRNTIYKEAIPFLDNLVMPEHVLTQLKREIENARPRVNSHMLEALAYTLIKCGDYSSALAPLSEIKQRLEKSTVSWDIEQRKRAQLIEEKLSHSPEAALTQLNEWKNWTINKLGLEKYVQPTN